MRKLGIVIAIVVACLALIVFVVPLLVNVNRYHDMVQSELEKALGRPVSFGQMHLSLVPPTVRMDNVVIGEAPQFGKGPFASTSAIDASIKLWPLIHKEIQIQSLDLKNPKVELIRDKQGVWNFSTLGQQQNAAAQQPTATPQNKPATQAQKQPAPTQAPTEPQQKSGGGFILSNLKITNGQVTLIDEQKNFRGVYNNIDLTLNGYEPGKAFDFNASLHLPGAGTETLALSGTAGPINQSDMLKTPFDGKLQLNQVSLGGIQKALNVPSLNGIGGSASGNLALKNNNGTLSSNGSVDLKDGVVRNVNIGYPVSLDYKATDQLASNNLHIDQAKLMLGNMPLSLSGDINGGATPATVNIQLNTQNASISELARLASAFGVAFNPGMTVNGNLTANIHAQGPISQPALNGNVSSKDLRISGGSLKQPVQVSGIQVALTPRDIRSNPFTAASGSTQVSVQFAMTNYTSPSPQVDATLRTGNAQIAELLGMARAYGVSAVDGMDGTGNISLDLHAAGPVKNTSAMNFSGSGKISNATLKTPQITQPLAVQNADLKFSQNSAAINNLTASLAGTTATGNMTVRSFNAPQVQFTLNANQVDVLKLEQAVGMATPPPAPQQKRAWFDLVPRAEAQTRRAPAAPAAPSIVEKISGGGNVTIGNLIYDQLQLQQVQSKVLFDRGVVRLAPITAGIYGGQQIGTVTADLRQTPMAITASTKLSQVDANKLLSSVSSVKQTLYGLLSGNANTNFRVGNSATDIARSLNGSMAIDLTKGKLAHIDLLNELANVGKFVGNNFKSPSSSSGQPFTDIVQLTGNFNVVNGLAQTNNLKALIPGGSIGAEGAINLATDELNMHLTAVLDKALSQTVGGTQIGGFMQTALANRQGELVIPILLTGTFNSPRVAPDLQKIAQMKLNNLLPTAGNPTALTSAILGAIGGNKGGAQQPAQGGIGGILGAIAGQQQQKTQGQQPVASPPQQQPPAQQQQQNPVGNILNQVFGQKKQQQPPPKQ